MSENTGQVYKKLPLNEKGELIPNGTFIASPRNLVIISFPKSGKTETMVNHPNILIGDCEGGTDYYAASNIVNLVSYDGDKPFVQLKSGAFVPTGIYEAVSELYKANRMKEYWDIYNKFVDARGAEKDILHAEIVAFLQSIPFPIFAVDTLTHLQELVNKAALMDYNAQFGKSKTDIKRVDDYSGSQYTRRTMMELKKFIEYMAAPFIIYTGHIKEKKKIFNKGSDEISAADMALEGTLGTIFTAKADANCIFYRNNKGCFMDFKKKEETDMDSRPRHLANKSILIAEPHTHDKEGNILERGKTHWEKIYPELKW